MKNQERDLEINDLTIESILVTAEILLRISYLMAPIAPYFAEYLFQNTKVYFKNISNIESIHLTEYDYFYSLFNNAFLEEQFKVIEITENQFKLLDYVRRMRSDINIPRSKMIKKAYYISNDFTSNYIDPVFIEEMNLPDICFASLNEMKVNPIKLVPKINIKIVSQIFKKDASKVKELINNLDDDKLIKLYNKETLELEYTSGSLRVRAPFGGVTTQDEVLTPELYEIKASELHLQPEMIDEWKYSLVNKQTLYESLSLFESEKLKDMVGPNFILILDTTYDKDMVYKNFIQNVARRFQRMRKFAGLNPWDPIKLYINTDNQMVIDICNTTDYQSLFFETTHRIINVNDIIIDYIYKYEYQCTLEGIELNLNLGLAY